MSSSELSERYRVEEVTKVYAARVVANDAVTLHIRAGEVFGLLGPNGAGKTTLVRQMVGLLRPDRGRILYDGRPVTPGDARLRRRVAYLAQRPLALLDLTVREAITYTARLRGSNRERAVAEAGDLIELLDLGGCADRVVATLSGGQHRLVSLGSALVGEAETLVLDEPTNELDPEMRRRVWAALHERCRSRGATVVLVTHNALEAEQVIERLAVLVGARIVALGTPGEIKAGIDSRVRIELTFRDEPAVGLIELASVGSGAQTAPNRLVLSAPRHEARGLIDRVLGRVSLDDLDDFRVLTPTLEDVYLQVAGRDAPAQTMEVGR